MDIAKIIPKEEDLDGRNNKNLSIIWPVPSFQMDGHLSFNFGVYLWRHHYPEFWNTDENSIFRLRTLYSKSNDIRRKIKWQNSNYQH